MITRLLVLLCAWLWAVPVSAQWITQNGISSTRLPIRLIPITQPSATQEGTIYYDSATHTFKVYNGTAWVAIGAVSSVAGSALGTLGDALHPMFWVFNANTQQNMTFWNQSKGSSAYAEFTLKSDTTRMTFSTEGVNSSDAPGAQRGQIYTATQGGTSGTNGLDLISCEAATPALCFTRFTTNGYPGTATRATIDVNGLTLNNGTSLQSTATTGLAVANVGANSCGTTTATIAGSNLINVITVGATSGTQCRIAFTFAAATEWDCVPTDATTTGAVRATPVDTTHTDVIGSFTAGDKITSICVAR